ncbi:MAG TPA: hypothetical protein H9936_04895 [Candidatus Agathobaculum intestinigallinarum]|nr:hypothetical protein [Candidatus Agathobaculum intestinigallinarum]
MVACTFFGHRDCPDSICPKLRSVLVDLIENQQADTFYVGRQGSFDELVYAALRELSAKYPHIRYAVVLERLSGKSTDDFTETLFPEAMENVPPRFAIDRRNNWMLQQADFVVVYVTHTWGGAAKFAKKAEKQGKTVINLAD